MKIKPVKGRPMLHWVGKRPIDTISNYPAQLIDSYNVENPEQEPTYDRFKDGPNLLFHGDNKEILSTLLVQGFRGKFEPASAAVNFERQGNSVAITIAEYISPTILARMDIDRTIFDKQIDDFRAQIDCVLIDTDYTGEHFNIVESDVPEKKENFVDGEYTVSLPRPDAAVAVKIIDMLGEETVFTE